MRVLVLTAKTIWPLLGGAEIRNFSLLKETSKHHEVYLLSFLLGPNDREDFGGLEPYCMRILTPAEEDPSLEGDLRLVDCEDESAVDVSITPALLKRYHEAREEYDRRLDQFCRSRQIVLAAARTDTPLETLVLESLRRKGLLQ